mmetsp:Transcript_29005/g.57854  ORF Transcript_29005/g.57854 Transcript_29005/m.57854 type:complete len:267 (+) Transcript_29005:119-919(+)
MFLRRQRQLENESSISMIANEPSPYDPIKYTDAPDWQLTNCCSDEEIIFLSLMFGYLLANFFLWNTALLKPMKLIAVFVHEMSHATACWITGGKVLGIEVFGNEGGVTKYQGGVRGCIIPAGYLGCSFWGAVFVTLSGDRTASLISACLFLFALAISLCFAPNRIMVFLSLGFMVLTMGFIFLDRFVFEPLLQYLTLYYGVFIGSFSVYDIYDDLITRTVEGSDAHACHQLIPCCLPRCVGLQFVIVALGFQSLGLYFALVWMSST